MPFPASRPRASYWRRCGAWQASCAKAALLTQNLNYDLRWQQRASEFPLLTGDTPREEILLVKFADYHADHINFHAMFLAREKPAGKWQAHARTSRQIPLFQNLLTDLAAQAGLGEFSFWGNYAAPLSTPKNPTT